MDRRAYLSAVGIAALAGCFSTEDDEPGNGDGDSGDDDNSDGNDVSDGDGDTEDESREDDEGDGTLDDGEDSDLEDDGEDSDLDDGDDEDRDADDEEGDDESEETDDETDEDEEDEEDVGDPEWEISLDAPEEVEIGEEWTYAITVENVGDADGSVAIEGYVAEPDSDWEPIGTADVSLEAGESNTFDSETFAIRYVTRITLRWVADDAEATSETAVLPATRAFGESYRTPDGIVTTAHEIELREEYEYERYDGSTATQEASDDHQWAFLTFEAENDSGASGQLPRKYDVVVLAEDSRFGSMYTYKDESDEYEGGEVEDGTAREGWIAYEIPEELSEDELTVAYAGRNDDGEWSVEWRTE